MKILITSTSPYARKARIVVLEKRLDCEIVTATPWENDPQLLAVNPLREVPTLIADDGSIITDSRVICEYLDTQGGAPYLLPLAPESRVKAQSRVAVAEGALDAALNIIMARRVAPEMNNLVWREWLMNKVSAVLTCFNQEAVARDGFDLSDIGCFCLLDMLLFRMPDYDWRNSYPALAAWFARTAPRESLKQTDPRL